MYPTAEVRWFVEDPLPEAVEEWFHHVAGAHVWESRTDRYVRPASADGLGVKGRTGNLEVKRLARVVGTEALHPDVVGRMELWRKWSFPLAAAARLTNDAGDWVAVTKRRQKGTFAVRDGGVERVRREGQTGRGCSLEVAEVRAAGRTWWSVSFEAFGSYEEDALAATLRRAADHVFDTPPPFALDAEASMSYPAWLWRLANNEGASAEGR